MSGSFASLNTALSALRYNRVALDTAGQNIANVGTEGYTRRRVEAASAGTPTRPAMWSRSQDSGGGVTVTGINRMADAFLDARVRTEHGKQSYLDTRQAVLDRLETGLGEPGDDGVSAVLAEFRQAWSDLANDPSGAAARSQVLARGEALADAIRLQTRNFAAEAGDQRVRLKSLVAEVNTAASDLAATNRAIAVARLDGSDAGNLLDQRDQLALRLAQLTGGTASLNDAGGLDVAVNGAALVTGGIAGRLELASGVTPAGGADGRPVTFQVTHPVSGTTAVTTGTAGEIGAVAELLDTTIPAYVAELGNVTKTLADGLNALHRAGYDSTGAPGGTFFTYDPADPAGTLATSPSGPGLVAAAGVPGGVVDGTTADAIGELTDAESAYQRLIGGFGTTVASGSRLAATQSMLTSQVDGARDQLAGVNLDEEMLAMVQYQRAYEASARVITTVDAMLDTLINRTELTR
jgi:flagellar hook-associated protein 1 FlgK